MKITKALLKKLIKEELAKESLFDRLEGEPDAMGQAGWQEEGTPITPIEDLVFTPEGEEEYMEVFKADGEDAIRVLRDEAAFNDWKAAVGAGSTVKQGIRGTVWEPVSGPWKDRHDQHRSEKGRAMARYGSH